MASEQNRVPDVLLDRYLAEDLSLDARRQLEAELAAHPEVRARLDSLAQDREAFLASDSPATFARRVAGHLEMKDAAKATTASQRRWRPWAWVLGPSAAAATAAVLVTAITATEQPADSTSAVLMVPSPTSAKEELLRELRAPAASTAADTFSTRDEKSDGRLDDDDELKVSVHPKKRKMEMGETEVRPSTNKGAAVGPRADKAKARPAPKPPAAKPERRRASKVAAGGAAEREYAAEVREEDSMTRTPAAAPAPAPAPATGFARTQNKRASLDQNQLRKVVRAHIRDLRACIDSSEGVAPGKIELVLTWTVTPRGHAKKPALHRPEELRNTAFSRCVEREIRTWRFPEATGSTAAKVPFTVVNK